MRPRSSSLLTGSPLPSQTALSPQQACVVPRDAHALKGGVSCHRDAQTNRENVGPRRGVAAASPACVRFDRRHFDGRLGSVGAEGCISDLSTGGMGLFMRPAIPVGTSLAVGPLGSAAAPLPPAHVVRRLPAGAQWCYGCSLDRRLSEEELRAWLP